MHLNFHSRKKNDPRRPVYLTPPPKMLMQNYTGRRFTHISTVESSFYVSIPWSLIVDRRSALQQKEPI